jgi:hypothetical protein
MSNRLSCGHQHVAKIWNVGKWWINGFTLLITYIATLDWLRLVWQVYGLKFNKLWARG